MPSYNVKTKEPYPVDAPLPGDVIPCADFNGLRELGATEFYPRSLEYRHSTHTLKEFQRPGYFVDETRDHLREGDEIFYTLKGGKELPSEWTRGIAIVESVPNSKDRPLILAGLVQLPNAEPWTGDK